MLARLGLVIILSLVWKWLVRAVSWVLLFGESLVVLVAIVVQGLILARVEFLPLLVRIGGGLHLPAAARAHINDTAALLQLLLLLLLRVRETGSSSAFIRRLLPVEVTVVSDAFILLPRI